jgi:2-polyprenyl-3-methyl-5-hydroxy-6-metoxy-1,4-benzoquinol methylase
MRWAVGWSLYHELDLPMDKVQSTMKSSDADQWHYGAIQDRRRRAEVKAAMDWIVNHVPKNKLIAEVGCGCGANLVWLARRGYHNLIGTDRSASAIEAAKGLAETPIVFRVDDGFVPPANDISC